MAIFPKSTYDREVGVAYLTFFIPPAMARGGGWTPITKEEGMAILTETFPIPPAGTEEGRKLREEISTSSCNGTRGERTRDFFYSLFVMRNYKKMNTNLCINVFFSYHTYINFRVSKCFFTGNPQSSLR